MSCPFCMQDKDCQLSCELDKKAIEQRDYDYYCSASGEGYERCDRFRKAEVLTPTVCNAILSTFRNAVQSAADQLCEFAGTLGNAVIRTSYGMLLDAFQAGARSPSPPKARGRFKALAKTAYEKELAEELEDQLDSMLEHLDYGRYFHGAYVTGALQVSTEEINRLCAELDLTGARAAEALEDSGFSYSDGAGKYVSEAEKLAYEAGSIVRSGLRDSVWSAVREAQYTLENGIDATRSEAGNLRSSLRVLDDANIVWETDDDD